MSNDDSSERVEINAAVERLTAEALRPNDPGRPNVIVDANDLRHALTEIIQLRQGADRNVANHKANVALIRELKHLADGLLVSVRTYHKEACSGDGVPSAGSMHGMITAADKVDAKLRQVGRS